MKEIREILQGKLLEIIENKDKSFDIKDIKDAAAVLRELREMDGPKEGQKVGGVVELG